MQNFFVQSFSTTLRVMDVRAENRGRPHQKVRFPAAPVVGRNFSTLRHPGIRVRNVRGESGPKSLCLCCFFFPEIITFVIIRKIITKENVPRNSFVIILARMVSRKPPTVMTVGLLYGGGAEALGFVTGTYLLRKITENSCPPAEKPKSAVIEGRENSLPNPLALKIIR